MKTTLLFLILSFSTTLFASSSNLQALCPHHLEAFQNIQIQQNPSEDGKRCYLSLHPRDAYHTLIYRDYLIGSDGFLMIFNSYSAQEGPGSDGAREFFFFPSEFKGFSWSVEGNYLNIKGLVGQVLQFELSTAQLVHFSNAELKLSRPIRPDNQGGVDIVKAQFPFIDAGFRMGDSPSADPKRSSRIQNSEGKQCVISNSQIYDNSDGNIYLKPIKDIQLAVQSQCPGFQIQ